MLHVGPAGLGYGGDAGAALGGKELGLTKLVVKGLAATYEVARVAGAATLALLRGLHGWREGEIGESV